MATEFDDKGKIFTNVISKRPIPVLIQISGQRIQGKLHVPPTERIKDELNAAEQYLAITDATIYAENGEILYKSQFLTLNREFIIWLIPEGELQS
jgi:hypothetical protein